MPLTFPLPSAPRDTWMPTHSGVLTGWEDQPETREGFLLMNQRRSSVMQVHDGLHQRQPKANPRIGTARPRGVRAVEPFEQVRPVFRRYAWAGVTHGEFTPSALGSHHHHDFS